MAELRKPIEIVRVEVIYMKGEESYTATYRDQTEAMDREKPFGKKAAIEEEWTLSSPVTSDEMIMLSMFNELILSIKEAENGAGLLRGFNTNDE